MRSIDTFKRAFKDLFKVGRKYYTLFFLQSVAIYSLPFIGFIYMTRIVAALTDNQIPIIPALISQYLIILLVLQLINGFLQPLVVNEETLFKRSLYALPNSKMLTMQYQYAEKSEVREQLEIINRNMAMSQSSLPGINMRLENIIPNVVRIVWAIILLAPLFRINTSQLPEQYWWMHPGLILLAFGALLAVCVIIQIKASKESGRTLKAMMSEFKNFNALFNYEYNILEDVQSGKEIRLYDLTQKMITTMDSQEKFMHEKLTANYKQYRKISLPVSSLFQLINYTIYAYIGILVLLGAFPIAMIIQLSSALSQVVSAAPGFVQSIMMMLSSPDELKHFYEFMDLPDEEVVGSLPVEKRLDNEYTFDIDKLSFAYPGSEELVLKDIIESFEVGKRYAIVGENGSGKTTFIKLLTRLYEPTEGRIKMNKIDSSKYDLREYFNLFGVVFQDYHLVGFSLGQNVSVSPIYDKERVMATLDKVGLSDFIKNIPNQLETFLGTEFDDSGVNISGGQEQKLAIARSLYKDAPVVILDEPTAALDPLTEFEIYQNFDNLVEDKTAFYISHRLSSSKFCNEILVFDKGEIIQRGTHDDLVGIEGKYQELWSAQAQYYQ